MSKTSCWCSSRDLYQTVDCVETTKHWWREMVCEFFKSARHRPSDVENLFAECSLHGEMF